MSTGADEDRQGPDRRDAILVAAAEVIGERGIGATRITDVAARAGVSAGLAVYYFKSKDRLLAEALLAAEDRFYARTVTDLAEMARAADRLVRLIELSCPLLDEEDDYAEWTLWIQLWAQALHDPAVRDTREQLDRRWRETIATIVRDGRRQLEFAPIDVDDFVLRLTALIDGLVVQVLLGDPEISAQRMRGVVVGMAARELGFAPPASDADPADH
jgi:AcrR family transcriptional regulator